MPKGKQSEVGETQPTEKSTQELENLVSNVLDAPAPPPKSTLTKEEKGLEQEEESQDAENQEEKSESGEAGSEEQPAEESSEEKQEDSEDVVPLSKHQKALDSMQRRIDKLTAEIKQSDLKAQSKASTQEEKLMNLTGPELDELQESTTEAIEDVSADIRDARRNDPDNVQALEKRLGELRDLRRNAKKASKDAPRRFQMKQIEHLNEMVQEVKEIDPEVTNLRGDLWEVATRIYKRMPSLQSSVTGQAEALAAAAEYYVEQQSAQGSREKASALSQKVANLKRKTALEGKNRVATAEKVSSKKLRDVAKSGNYYDKLSYIKTLVPDEFLQQ
jgi:hypothetical protein